MNWTVSRTEKSLDFQQKRLNQN